MWLVLIPSAVSTEGADVQRGQFTPSLLVSVLCIWIRVPRVLLEV